MKTKLFPAMILTAIVTASVVILTALQTEKPVSRFNTQLSEESSTLGICSPFYLLTEEVDTFDPTSYMKYGDHYRVHKMMGYDEKPTFAFSPELAYYKGVIYPGIRGHTAWQVIQTNLEPGLMPLRMKDIYAKCVKQS